MLKPFSLSQRLQPRACMGSCRNIAAIAIVGSNPKCGAYLSMICMRSFFQISHVSSGFDCLLTLSHGMAVGQDLVKKKMTFTETFENACFDHAMNPRSYIT